MNISIYEYVYNKDVYCIRYQYDTTAPHGISVEFTLYILNMFHYFTNLQQSKRKLRK